MEMFECSRCVLVSGKGKYASKLAGPTISSRWIEGANTGMECSSLNFQRRVVLLALFAEVVSRLHPPRLKSSRQLEEEVRIPPRKRKEKERLQERNNPKVVSI
jgi:hypothetical protein